MYLFIYLFISLNFHAAGVNSFCFIISLKICLGCKSPDKSGVPRKVRDDWRNIPDCSSCDTQHVLQVQNMTRIILQIFVFLHVVCHCTVFVVFACVVWARCVEHVCFFCNFVFCIGFLQFSFLFACFDLFSFLFLFLFFPNFLFSFFLFIFHLFHFVFRLFHFSISFFLIVFC